jgi:hypothetical protein
MEQDIQTVVNALIYFDAQSILVAKANLESIIANNVDTDQRTIALEAMIQVLED